MTIVFNAMSFMQVFGSMLMPRSERIPSLNDLWGGAFQVICFLHAQTELPVMWTCEEISSPWPNTVNVDNLIAFLNSHPPWVFMTFQDLSFHEVNKFDAIVERRIGFCRKYNELSYPIIQLGDT